jgi:hypothetical protein
VTSRDHPGGGPAPRAELSDRLERTDRAAGLGQLLEAVR